MSNEPILQASRICSQYFYSIKDISIGGRCMCNGHADTCDIQDPNMPNKLVCRCQHNTCGPQCATCCKGFEQKKWRQSTAFKKFTCERKNNSISHIRSRREGETGLHFTFILRSSYYIREDVKLYLCSL